MAAHICTRCHTTGWPRPAHRGSVTSIGLVVLGLFGMVIGVPISPFSSVGGMMLVGTGILVSSLESSRRSGPLCRVCETGPLVPITTPAGRELANRTGTPSGTP